MNQVLRGLAANNTQLVQTVPYCMLSLARGLMSKKVPCGNGVVSYTLAVSDYVQAPTNREIGYAPFGFNWNIGTPDTSTLVNLIWPTLNNTVPGYTDTLGAQAFQRLCQIMTDDDPTGACRMVDVKSPTSLDSDVSCFAYSRPSFEVIGLSTEGPTNGGCYYPLNLEVPIFRPQFSAINSAPFVPGTQGRYGNLHANACGDGTTLGAGQASWFKEQKWKMQRPPKLHFIDFNEFGDVVAKWVAAMQQAFLNDPANAGVNPSTLVCNLTLQEMLLLLRNVLMTAFKETQASFHACYPVVPADQNDNVFVPFIVGTNTCYLTSTPMSLPIPLIENIRALVYRFICRGGTDWEFFCPVLGQFSQEFLSENDYTFKPAAGEPILSFTPRADVALQKVRGEKGEDKFIPLIETTIGLVDGNSSLGYVCINDPNALEKTLARWEDWLKLSNVTQNSVGLAPLGTESGISVLCSVNLTRFLGNPLITHDKVAADKRRALIGIIDLREKRKELNHSKSSIYTNVEAQQDSAQSKILQVAYEEVLSTWILPQVRFRVDNLNAITPIRWQAISSEVFSSLLTNGTEGEKLDDMHAAYAQKMIRAKLGQPTTWEAMFAEMARQGRGGIISGIIGKFADAIIPGAGGLVQQVGNVIGI